MPIGIYPPTLQSSQPAFLYTQSSYTVHFSLQKITSFKEIGHVQIRVVKQSNNRTIVNTGKYPDGIIYKSPDQIFTITETQYSIDILNADLAETWQPGSLYKVQMRFGSTAMFTSISEFATWKKKQIDDQTFSEWSTVMVIKPISKPDTYIQNNMTVNSTDITSSEHIEYVLTPMFFGVCKIEEKNKEIVNKYKFDLYIGKKTLEEFLSGDTEDLLETSGWTQRNATTGAADQYRFRLALDNDETYTVFYSIETINGYMDIAKPYSFVTTQTYLNKLNGLELRIEHEDNYCKDNGCMNIYLTVKNNQKLSGTYVIIRSSEKSNYKVWEDIKYVHYFIQEFDNKLIFQDFTIESGIRYKYAFQQENAAGLRTAPVYEDSSIDHCVNFEYSFLYHNDTQLRLMFNQKINSFKHTVLTSKQDTLGDKYPHLVKNGNAYYAEFPISGLISFQMDEGRTFFRLKNDGFYYGEDLIVPRVKFEEWGYDRDPNTDESTKTNYNDLMVTTELTDDNIFAERKFREKVEEFLNNFDYKLYKSPTEGNIVVVLQNVILTPNSSLGRMIYEFNATAYEVMDNTLMNLDEHNIIHIGKFGEDVNINSFSSFGQITGIYTNNRISVDIYNQIKQQEEVAVGGGYRLSLQKVKSFWIERYPNKESILNNDYKDGNIVAKQVRDRQVCTADITRLEAALAEAKNNHNESLISYLEQEINKYQKIQNQVKTQWLEATIMFAVNGKKMIVAPHKIYSLDYPISSLELIASDYPVIINYICELKQVEDITKSVITAIDSSRIWGQISGVFTETDRIIKNGYKYHYGEIDMPPYRVYSGDITGTIVDNTNYNLYKTLNLYEVIKEDTRKQVELMYNILDGFTQNEEGKWVSGNLQYEFSGLTGFNIEADPGTILLIGKQEDGSDAVEVIIGETRRYEIYPVDNIIKYIELKRAAFVIVNYRCVTSQMRMG